MKKIGTHTYRKFVWSIVKKSQNNEPKRRILYLSNGPVMLKESWMLLLPSNVSRKRTQEDNDYRHTHGGSTRDDDDDDHKHSVIREGWERFWEVRSSSLPFPSSLRYLSIHQHSESDLPCPAILSWYIPTLVGHTDRLADTHTDRETDRKTDWQKREEGKEADRQRQIQRSRETEEHSASRLEKHTHTQAGSSSFPRSWVCR